MRGYRKKCCGVMSNSTAGYGLKFPRQTTSRHQFLSNFSYIDPHHMTSVAWKVLELRNFGKIDSSIKGRVVHFGLDKWGIVHFEGLFYKVTGINKLILPQLNLVPKPKNIPRRKIFTNGDLQSLTFQITGNISQFTKDCYEKMFDHFITIVKTR